MGILELLLLLLLLYYIIRLLDHQNITDTQLNGDAVTYRLGDE